MEGSGWGRRPPAGVFSGGIQGFFVSSPSVVGGTKATCSHHPMTVQPHPLHFLLCKPMFFMLCPPHGIKWSLDPLFNFADKTSSVFPSLACSSTQWHHPMCLSDPKTAVLIGGEGAQQQSCKDPFWTLQTGKKFGVGWGLCVCVCARTHAKCLWAVQSCP